MVCAGPSSVALLVWNDLIIRLTSIGETMQKFLVGRTCHVRRDGPFAQFESQPLWVLELGDCPCVRVIFFFVLCLIICLLVCLFA